MQPYSTNLHDLLIFDNTAASQGFYILCRVRQHVLFDEPFDDGWGEAHEALQNIWVREFRVEYREVPVHA